MKDLPVTEFFYTWQGEGLHMGRAAFFIRLHGCPVHCPWCDSAGTWHKNYVPKNINRMSVKELTGKAIDSGAEFIVITGGEPTIHDLTDLIQTAHNVFGLPCHLETCGAFEIKGDPAFITLSPKRDKPPLMSNLLMANEIKIIVDNEQAVDEWEPLIRQLKLAKDTDMPTVWLHPEWSQRNNPAILSLISNTVKNHPDIYRAGYQMHKLYKVDALDPNSAPLAPLGGDPSKGF